MFTFLNKLTNLTGKTKTHNSFQLRFEVQLIFVSPFSMHARFSTCFYYFSLQFFNSNIALNFNSNSTFCLQTVSPDWILFIAPKWHLYPHDPLLCNASFSTSSRLFWFLLIISPLPRFLYSLKCYFWAN